MSIEGLRTRVEAGRWSWTTAGGLVRVRGRDRVPIVERLDDQRRVSGAQMQVPLRQGDRNAVLTERLLDLQQQVMGGCGAVSRPGDEARDIPLQGLLTKGLQEHRGCRGREHAWMAADELSEQALDQIQVAAVGYPDR